MVQRMATWLDQHLWILPFLVFLVGEAILIILHFSKSNAFFLAAADADRRKDIYSSLTGSSSGLLGFALAAIAIMAAFGRRAAATQESRDRENSLAHARVGISKILLATSIFLMIILITSTVAIGVDDGKIGSFVLTSTITSAAVASLTGLLVSGVGLTLSLMERSREP